MHEIVEEGGILVNTVTSGTLSTSYIKGPNAPTLAKSTREQELEYKLREREMKLVEADEQIERLEDSAYADDEHIETYTKQIRRQGETLTAIAQYVEQQYAAGYVSETHAKTVKYMVEIGKRAVM